MMEEVHEGQLAVLPVAKDVLGWYFEPKDENGVRISQTAIATTTENAGAAIGATSSAPAIVQEELQEE
jgi:hypothetical protein